MHKEKLWLSFLMFVFVLYLAPQAWAAQTLVKDVYGQDGYYISTPKKAYPDNLANYPNEIYLPNERNPESYRIHSNYTKNTDACASCHATHTAVGSSLLQWYSNYDTCMACHDGTVTTTYNVAGGVIPNSMQLTFGGSFGVGHEDSSSYHNVTGGVLISSAPGNNTTKGLNNNKPLGCESCHSPHGMGGNARLLNPDPNGVQSIKEDKFTNYPLSKIGETDAYVIYAAYPKNPDGNFNFMQDPYYMLKGYPYNVQISVGGEAYKEYDEVFNLDNKDGFSKVYIWKDKVTGPITATFVPSLRVRMNITNYLGVGGQEQVSYRDGTSAFCASCHDDYMNDVSSSVYRHPVEISIKDTSVVVDTYSTIYTNQMKHKFETNEKMVCLTCHVAHGTSSNFWKDSMGYTDEDSKERSGSSALKIAPNSDLCEVCHQKGKAQEGYNANTNQPHNNPEYATQDASFIQLVGVTNYVGSNLTSCAGSKCHTPIVDTWKDTTHSAGMTDKDGINTLAAANWQAGINKAQVVYVLGDKWKQNYIYEDNGILKVARGEFIISTKSWNTRPATDNFIDECAGCHTTGLNIATDTWADYGVACEACHGTANNHVTVASSRNITNPRYLKMADQTDICAQCHTFGFNNNDNRPYPVGYMPHAEGLRDTVTAETYKLSNFFTAYNFEDQYPGNFYNNQNPTSTVRDSAYAPQEFNDFVQSKHYQSGAMSCMTCHSSHKPNSKGQMLKVTFQQTCGSCHGTSFNIDAVMPKRSMITNNPADNLRVHTFSKQHNSSDEKTGNYKVIH